MTVGRIRFCQLINLTCFLTCVEQSRLTRFQQAISQLLSPLVFKRVRVYNHLQGNDRQDIGRAGQTHFQGRTGLFSYRVIS